MAIKTEKKKIINIVLATMLTLLFICAFLPTAVFAASAAVQINVADAVEKDGKITVPIVITGSENIGNYTVVIEYDTSRLKYSSGGDQEGKDCVILSGTGLSREIRYNLVFDILSGGRAGLAVGYTSVGFSGSDTEVPAKTGETVYVRLSGENTGDSSFRLKADIADMAAESGMPIIGRITIDGEGNYYIIDQSIYVPAEVNWTYKKIEGTFLGRTVTFLTDADENTRLLYKIGRAHV